MGLLKLDVEEIKTLISLREEYWEYDFHTNCYAFALGLDIPEQNIIEKAYQLGVMGAIILDIPIHNLKKLTLEERLFLDLEALKINYREASLDEESGYEFYSDSINTHWIISLFSNGKSFHFLRKNYNGIWYHKFGYFAPPMNHDFNGKIITDLNNANMKDYKLIKTYQLEYSEKR